MAADFSVVLDELNTTLESIEAVLDVDYLRQEIAELEQQAAAPDLWNDVEAAQALTSRLSFLQGTLRRVEELRSRLDDVGLMHEMLSRNDQLDPNRVDDVVLGCVSPVGDQGADIAKTAAIKAGLPDTVAGWGLAFLQVTGVHQHDLGQLRGVGGAPPPRSDQGTHPCRAGGGDR